MRKTRLSKFLAVLLSCTMVLGSGSTMIYAAEPDIDDEANYPVTLATTGLNVESRSIEQIREFAEEHPASLTDSVTYTKVPDVTSGTYTVDSLSVLSEETETSALNLLNQIRYISGLDGDVTIDANYSSAMSAATFLDYLNGTLSHYPEKPNGVSDELYTLGYEGAGEANLSWGSSSSRPLNQAIISWMADSSSDSNIETVGHRRWIINPRMKYTAFGVTNGTGGTYAAMYSFDSSRSAGYSMVAWPAQNTPIDYYTQGSPWSLSIGSTVNADDVSVTVVRNSDEATWNFSSTDSSGGYFNVNNGNYGQTGCIIFQPDNLTVNSGDTFTVTITGATTDEISYSVNFFNLEVETITEEMFDVDTSDETYTGSAITKKIESDLVEGTDYEVTYTNNINAGEATITITGIGNYTGELTYHFTIVPAPFSEGYFTVLNYEGYYDGEAHSISVELSSAAAGATVAYSTTGEEGTYTTENPEFTDAGTYTVYYKVVSGDGNYETTGSAIVQINAAYDISADMFDVDTSDVTYIGIAITKHIGSDLVEGTDYTVSYENNTNVGTATIIITGTGAYGGELMYHFNILPAEFPKGYVDVSGYNGIYDGDAHSITVDLSEEAEALGATVTYSTTGEEGSYTPEKPEFIDAGTYTVYYKVVSGDGNYETTGSATVKINAIEITDDMFAVDTSDVPYTGSPITKEITSDLVEGTDYTVTYTDNINAGTATITITGIGDYSGTLEYTFTINKAVYDMSGVTFPDKTYTYDGKEHAIKLEIEDGGSLPDGVTVSYTNNTGTEVGTYNATAHFTGDDPNYETIADMTATMTIVNASSGNWTTTVASYIGTYDGKAHSITVTLSGDAEDAIITYSTEKDGNYTEEKPEFTDAGTYTVYFKVSLANGNYIKTTGSGTVKINARMITADMFNVDTDTVTYNGSAFTKEITSDLVEGMDYTVSYVDNTNAGIATITITGMGNYTGTVSKDFTINKANQSVSASASTSSIEVGATATITASGKGTITYSSNNTSVATVSSTGVVTGKAAGTATITVKAAGNDNYNSGSATVSIKVTEPALKKGSSYKVGDFKYKITDLPASGNGTVTVTKPVKTSIKTATIPAKVTIEGRSFKVTKVAASAFKDCTKLTSAIVGKNVTTIGKQAFSGCTKMTKITMKAGVTKIAKKAFYNCKNLKTITIKSKNLKTVGNKAITGIKKKATIKVPSGKKKAYTKLFTSATGFKKTMTIKKS